MNEQDAITLFVGLADEHGVELSGENYKRQEAEFKKVNKGYTNIKPIIFEKENKIYYYDKICLYKDSDIVSPISFCKSQNTLNSRIYIKKENNFCLSEIKISNDIIEQLNE